LHQPGFAYRHLRRPQMAARPRVALIDRQHPRSSDP
jgi:hypothetical protein